MPALDRLLDEMPEHRAPEGRFLTFATFIRQPDPAWSTLACDHYAITDVLVRFGRADDSRVCTALDLMAADLTQTSLGHGCRCLPHSRTGVRVTPRSVYRGFTDFSFGQKKQPSAIATAWVCAALRSFDAVSARAAALDVATLSSAKGGTGVAVPPR